MLLLTEPATLRLQSGSDGERAVRIRPAGIQVVKCRRLSQTAKTESRFLMEVLKDTILREAHNGLSQPVSSGWKRTVLPETNGCIQSRTVSAAKSTQPKPRSFCFHADQQGFKPVINKFASDTGLHTPR
jgi:hypothetical protein